MNSRKLLVHFANSRKLLVHFANSRKLLVFFAKKLLVNNRESLIDFRECNP